MPLELIAGVLLAAGLDWLEGLLPLLFVVIWIASQVMNLFRGARKADVRPQRQPPRPVGGGQAGPQADPDVTLEIEAFLRRTLQLEEERPPSAAAQAAGKTSRRRPRRTPAGGPPPVPANERVGRLAEGGVAGHVAAAFAHDLAHESPDAMAGLPAEAAPALPAAELAAAIRRPGGLRQLVLMQEVLARPTHRWE